MDLAAQLVILTEEARSQLERREALPQGSIVTRKGLQYIKTSNGWRRHKKYKPAGRASRGAKQGHRTRELRRMMALTR